MHPIADVRRRAGEGGGRQGKEEKRGEKGGGERWGERRGMWKKCGGRRAFSVLVQNLNSTDVLAVAYVTVLLDSIITRFRVA